MIPSPYPLDSGSRLRSTSSLPGVVPEGEGINRSVLKFYGGFASVVVLVQCGIKQAIIFKQIFRGNTVSERSAAICRKTKETQIEVKINLDGTGRCALDTGVPFLEHMLEQIARHGLLDLDIKAKGDLHIDGHHTVEDIGICLGQALNKAVGDKKGIRRYGHAYVPLDEALSRVVVDFSGRPGLVYRAQYPRSHVGEFDIDLVNEFFQGLSNHALITIHIESLYGKNAHHIAETIFKAFGRAARMALENDPRVDTIPSTKGSL
ncbi:MAG: hypothetical protein BMS9Abin11_1565 [Gammaproteobacteria bacterium]|nr:MAG: hypothetical protein BMS9Abin11_1565 [Gammaproteobacteria bacterium]